MTTLENLEKAEELLSELYIKSWEDKDFKYNLVNFPIKTIERYTGNQLPEETKIKVEDQSDNSKVYLNIPRKLDFDEFELSDEQLEQVAGGIVVGTALVFTAVGLAALGAGILVGRAMR